MAKLSADEAAQLKALQDKESAEDDGEEFSVWVRNSKGHETRLTGDTARRWLRSNGYDEDDADDATKGEPLPSTKAQAGAGPKPVKAAKPAAQDGGELEELDQDAPAQKSRRMF